MRAHYLTEIRLQVKRQTFADKFLKVLSAAGWRTRGDGEKEDRGKNHQVRRE